MTMIEDKRFFTRAAMDTPFNALCVKKKGKTFMELVEDNYGHGKIVKPPITTADVKNDNELREKLMELKEPFVTVRGHGWTGEVPFVWAGTTQEFLATWIGD